MIISNFKVTLLKWIAKSIVIQSSDHGDNMVKYFDILNEASQHEFNEETIGTTNIFLREKFEESIRNSEKMIGK